MSITTRDLKLRQKEVEKNLNETYSTLRRQPEGGLGALIQKPNHDEPPIRRVPTTFTPSPMLSSLPYLAEWVKYRSNENAINITAHLIRQRETAKASILYDDIKQNDLDMRNEEVKSTVSRNFSPSTAELLRKYLSIEIDKARDGERKIQEQRMARVDLAMNPVKPEAPAVVPALIRTLTSGDMGRPNIPDQAQLRDLRSMFYEQKDKEIEDSLKERVARADRDDQVRNISNRVMNLQDKANTLDIVRKLRKLKEDKLTAQLGESSQKGLKSFVEGMVERAPIKVNSGEIRPISIAEGINKKYAIPTIIKSRAQGILPNIPFGIPNSGLKMPKGGVKNEANNYGFPVFGGGGGGGGGGEPLFFDIRERMAKGIV